MQKLTVKAIRTNLGWSQEQMAQAIDMPLSTYRKKESGESRFAFDEMRKVSKVSGWSLDYILR
jgi:transcriptional regulator with XRE-family HTH domain